MSNNRARYGSFKRRLNLNDYFAQFEKRFSLNQPAEGNGRQGRSTMADAAGRSGSGWVGAGQRSLSGTSQHEWT
eukprot:3099897-Pleurochrysis_carterae.AAC.1